MVTSDMPPKVVDTSIYKINNTYFFGGYGYILRKLSDGQLFWDGGSMGQYTATEYIPSNRYQGPANQIMKDFQFGIFTQADPTTGLSVNPIEERKLAAYFAYLRDNFQTLTPEQRSDFEALQFKQNYFSTFINPTGKEFQNKQAKEFAKKDYLPGVENAGTSFVSYDSGVGNFKIVKNPTDIPSNARKFTPDVKNPNLQIYSTYDAVTRKTDYFYVIRDVKTYDLASVNAPTNLVDRYKRWAEIFVKDPKKTGGTPPPPTPPLPGPTPRAAAVTSLFYSQDYKQLYADELKRIELALLNMADLVIARFDWETIDFIPDTSGYVIRSEFGDPTYIAPAQGVTIYSNTNPSISNTIYKIQNNSIAPMMKILTPLRVGYESYLENFGFFSGRGDNRTLKSYFPGYTQNGSPYYDIELEFDDMPEVNSYRIFLVEEDGII